MKAQKLLMTLSVCGLVTLTTSASTWTSGMTDGKPGFKSIGPLAFGPEGILFAGDTKGASIFAVATGDTNPTPAPETLKIDAINEKIAAVLGSSANDILINDISVNPLSHAIYIAVSRGRGPDAVPVLVRVKSDGKPEVVSLEKVKFSQAQLPDAPNDDPKHRGGSQRLQSITDIAFFQDHVLIAGLSNEEFGSTFREITFPFKTVDNGTTVEIYHGSHGQFETKSPIRTFVPFNVGNEPQLLAAYTCTPLVQFPIKDIRPGAKVKGKTIAELGNHNRPIDMIVYHKGGKDYLLLANQARGVMKMGTDQIRNAEAITAPVSETKGLPFETIKDWTGVLHLDEFDANRALVLRSGPGGTANLEALPLP
jgi:hypothetical protein